MHLLLILSVHTCGPSIVTAMLNCRNWILSAWLSLHASSMPVCGHGTCIRWSERRICCAHVKWNWNKNQFVWLCWFKPMPWTDQTTRFNPHIILSRLWRQFMQILKNITAGRDINDWRASRVTKSSTLFGKSYVQSLLLIRKIIEIGTKCRDILIEG